MSEILKQIYDRSPVVVQNALLGAFSQFLNRKRFSGRYQEFRELLEQTQWWGHQDLRAWQEERLREVLVHAYQNVPYYRESFRRHGYDPARYSGLDDLQKLPVLERDVVKNRRKDLTSCAFRSRKLEYGHTSGTTGSPLALYYNADMVAMNYAAMDRQYTWAGLRMGAGGDRVAVLRGNVIVPLEQRQPPFWRFNRALSQMLFSSHHLSPQNVPKYVQALREFGPVALDGYPSSLFILAKIMLNHGEQLPLRAVVTSSESLYDFQRTTIETAFACKVFDYYAAAERVIFSVECDYHSGNHLCEEYGITEKLDDDDKPVSDGTEGALVGTTLHNLGMPLIRYRSNDRAVAGLKQCGCGRTLPLHGPVTTKSEDILRLRDGRLVSPSLLTHAFKELKSIDHSQLVQTDLDRLLVRVIPRADFSHADEIMLVRELKARLGNDMRIEIETTTSLPRTQRGKFKWVTNEVGTGL